MADTHLNASMAEVKKNNSGCEGAFILKTITPDIVSSLPEAELLASGNQLVEKAVLSV